MFEGIKIDLGRKAEVTLENDVVVEATETRDLAAEALAELELGLAQVDMSGIELEQLKMNRIEDVLLSLDTEIQLTESSLKDGGLTKREVAFLNDSISRHERSIGADLSGVVPALESFGGTASALTQTEFTLESLKEIWDKVWGAVSGVFKTLAGKIRALVKSLFGKVEGLKKAAEATKAKAAKASNEGAEKITVKGLEKLSLNGNIDNAFVGRVSNLAGDTKALLTAEFDVADEAVKGAADYVGADADEAKLAAGFSAFQKGFKGLTELAGSADVKAKHKDAKTEKVLGKELLGGKGVLVFTNGVIENGANSEERVKAAQKAFEGFARKIGQIDPSEKVDTSKGEMKDVAPISKGDCEKVADAIIKAAEEMLDVRKKCEDAAKNLEQVRKEGDSRKSDGEANLATEVKFTATVASKTAGLYNLPVGMLAGLAGIFKDALNATNANLAAYK